MGVILKSGFILDISAYNLGNDVSEADRIWQTGKRDI
jgi:hypothetical protein